jgi:mannitol-specific phosphotransferase system IIBC component
MDGPWQDRPGGPNRWKRWKIFLGVVAVAFTVTLAAIIGQRLSDQAISILAGAVCGVAASIPTSLLIIWVSRKQQQQDSSQSNRQMQGVYPPVVVVQPPAQMSSGAHQQQTYLPSNLQPTSREFTVVGGEMEEWSHRRH